jgi:phage/plasmid-associated DNA primase
MTCNLHYREFREFWCSAISRLHEFDILFLQSQNWSYFLYEMYSAQCNNENNYLNDSAVPVGDVQKSCDQAMVQSNKDRRCSHSEHQTKNWRRTEGWKTHVESPVSLLFHHHRY